MCRYSKSINQENNVKQRTIKKEIQTTGVGLHTGKKVTLTLKPAGDNVGVIYRRTDLSPAIDFLVNPDSVRDTQLCTCLVNSDNIRISTVEHLNAALAGLGIDNLIIEVNAPEIPIMDGSSSPFIYLLLEAGIQEQSSLKKFIKIKDVVRVENGDKWAEVRPYSGFNIDFTIDFGHPAMSEGHRRYQVDFSSKNFIKEISRARTFGFMHDIEQLQANGLCLGGSLDCAIVLDDYHVLNEDGLRYPDEFVRHKILDTVGDLFMSGNNMIGQVVCYKSGHALNNQLLRTLMNTQSAWEYVTFEENEEIPVALSELSLALA